MQSEPPSLNSFPPVVDIWRPSCSLNDEFWVTYESRFSCRTRCCTSWKTSLIWIKCVTARWRVWRTTCSSCSTDAPNCCSPTWEPTLCGTWTGVTHHRCSWFPTPCWRHECSERHGQVFKYYTSQSQHSFRGEFTQKCWTKGNCRCELTCSLWNQLIMSPIMPVSWCPMSVDPRKLNQPLSSGMLTVSGVASTSSSSYSPGRFSMCHSSASKMFKENSNNIY